ncbi:MAG: NAD(P)H-dependent oxidoreductase subunit E [Desulfomonile sp.]|jgi:NADH-quinone oxidoreductase subunit E|nr:NAD(P)H-dependent oxidoreductase subunit E [Deltaproteobacteria bacterium]
MEQGTEMNSCGESYHPEAPYTEILSGFGGDRRHLIGILQGVQEKLGYIPEEAFKVISNRLKISENEIFGVASFYRQFKFVESGKCVVKVCMGTACHVRGAPNILAGFTRKLHIQPDQTTEDKLFSLETVNCVGACALGPVVVFGGVYRGQVLVKDVEELIEKFRSQYGQEGSVGT